MSPLSHHPLFVAYAISCAVLCGNLLLLWVYSGVVRNRVKTTPNAEDVAQFGSTLSETEHPAIARVLRAHANALGSIVPFLFLALVYLLAAGPTTPGVAYFTIFCAARVAHSFAYVWSRQPWRTVSYLTALSVTTVLIVHVLWLALLPA